MAEPMPASQMPTTEEIKLVDIKEPPLPDTFYLTPLDVLVALAVVVLLIFIARKLYQRWQLQAPKREAIRELAALSEPSAAEINLLLKRFLRSVAGQHPALTQSGEAWQQFLAQTVSGNPHQAPDITELLYQAKPEQARIEEFYQYARYWLNHVKIGALHA